MKDNPFQTIIVGVFAALTVAGFIFFAMFRAPDDPGSVIGNVTIWGTYSQATMGRVLESLDGVLPSDYSGQIRYQAKDPDTYNDELVEALASGTGPDVFMLNQADIVRQLNKVHIVPYETFPQRTFKDRYIEGAEIFLTNEGVVGFPFAVDPLIMYYNRDILSRERIPSPPDTWVDFFELSPKITKRDASANVLQSTVPFGEYRNVTNGKEIVSALILQAGDPITAYNFDQGSYESVLGASSEGANGTAVSVLRFYTEFSNPTKSAYSWNRSLPDSRIAFLSGDLAFYFGFASELKPLVEANVNLNRDIAPLPQIEEDGTPKTFGRMQAMAVSKASQNKIGAFRVASFLTARPVLETLTAQTGLPPIRRDMLADIPTDDIGPVFYESALISHAWLEPDSEIVDTIFRDMIESISSGRLNIKDALREADKELELLF